jgi:N-acetylmuramoyl-L-alanine amidase
MRRLCLLLILLCSAEPLLAAVEIAPRGKASVRLEDVYQQGGVPYVAVEDALDAVGLTGHWNSVRHVFRIRTRSGWAEISPASEFLKFKNDFYPLQDKPRFIDGRLRVTDNFILNQLALLVGQPIFFRNLDPEGDPVARKEENALEQLFAFLLNKKIARSGPLIRAVAIDPGHGGLDTGAIGVDGRKEKEINLQIANKLSRQLKMKLGIPVFLSRDGDYELRLEQRLKPASEENVDVWLVLHAQSAQTAVPEGVSLFIRPEETAPGEAATEQPPIRQSASLRLADALALALRESGIAVNGIYPSPLLSLGRGELPTVQVELGYLSHPEELARLQSDKYQDLVAQALYQGIRRYAKASKESLNGIN